MGMRQFFKSFLFWLCAIGIVIVVLEGLLRFAGWGYLAWQDMCNRQRFQSDAPLTIMCIGESTTALGGEDAYPAQLEAVLHERLGRKPTVINKGVPGQNSEYILQHVEEWLDAYQPDIVVSMMGINDLVSLLVPFKDADDPGVLKKFINDLRVVKLANWFGSALGGLVRDQKEKNTTQSKDPGTSTKTFDQRMTALVFQALQLEAQGEDSKAKRLYMYLLAQPQANPLRNLFENNLIRLLERQNDYGNLMNALTYLPSYRWKQEWFDKVCTVKQGVDLCRQRIMARLEDLPQNYKLYEHLAVCYRIYGDDRQAQYYEDRADGLKMDYYSPMTEGSYAKLINILRRRNIAGVFVQYPLRSIEPLKKMIQRSFDVRDMIFVENFRNFEELLATHDYNQMFSDRFAGDFGHCTKLGNRVLAEAVAGAIIEKVVNKQ